MNIDIVNKIGSLGLSAHEKLSLQILASSFEFLTEMCKKRNIKFEQITDDVLIEIYLTENRIRTNGGE